MTELLRISTPLTVERLSRAIGFALDDATMDPEDVLVRHRNGCLVFETVEPANGMLKIEEKP